MNFDNDNTIKLIKDMGEKAYLVGGAVRDYLLGKSSFDKDILVASAKEFALEFSKRNDSTFIELDKNNKIYRVVLNDKINYIDITEPLNNSIEEDLRRRDFTINSIAFDLSTNNLIDINNGQQDLKNKIIRSISENNIIDDPLRILRAYRFAATLGFSIETDTVNQINKHLDLINKPAIERINYELMKLFEGEYTAETLLEMENIIIKLYPVFVDVKKVPKNSHHHLDLFNHSIETVNQIQRIYEKSSIDIKQHLETSDFGGFSRLAHLKLAGFFHDIGKFSTWTIEENGTRHRFIKHDSVGAKMIQTILKQNKFSKKQIEYISFLIKNHIYPSQVVASENVCEKIYMRYLRKTESYAIDNIIIAMADRLSAKGPSITDEIINTNINNLTKLLNFYLSIKDNLKPLPKLLSGNEIMKLKKIKASPLLGKIISKIKDEQINGNIITREDAIKFVKNYN